MSFTLKPISDQVIVITGASSGIGRTTASMAAQKGAQVVLASRNEAILSEIVADIQSAGGEAIKVVADVSKRDEVEKIANAALERFGRIDTWVNDAGVDVVGRLEAVSEEDARQLFDTNFWGVMHGSLVAIEHLKASGGGALINLGSIASDRAFPLQGYYCASKHAIKAFTDTLRMEMAESKAPISVTLIKPAAIGTPLVDQTKSYEGREARLPPPIYAPEEVALAILYAAQHPKRDIYVGGAGKMLVLFAAHAPRLFDRFSEAFGFESQLRKAPKTSPDNLHQAGPDKGDRGSQGPQARRSLYTRLSLNPVATGIALGVTAVGALGVAAALQQRRRPTVTVAGRKIAVDPQLYRRGQRLVRVVSRVGGRMAR